MGSWNTLHHFDDRKFYSEIVPDLKNDGQLLHKYFNSKFAKRILYRREDTIDKEIAEIIKFSRFLDKDFKLHETLYEIMTREKTSTNRIQILLKNVFRMKEILRMLMERLS
ncbi:MAG: hypothetical protein JNN23_07840, partial [Chryseobacterium gambrini]|nr:hypothetical protein [Chryseobacterium gambrini]